MIVYVCIFEKIYCLYDKKPQILSAALKKRNFEKRNIEKYCISITEKKCGFDSDSANSLMKASSNR